MLMQRGVRCSGVARFTSVVLLCPSAITLSASLRRRWSAPAVMVMLVVVVVTVVAVVLITVVLVVVAAVVAVDVVAAMLSVASGMALECLFSGCSVSSV